MSKGQWGFSKGYVPWNKGKKHSKEHIEKVSKALKGIKRSKETKLKMGLVQKGRKISISHKEKISKKVRELWQDSNYRKNMSLSMSVAHRGSKNHKWKGGVTLVHRVIRNCLKYRQWRSDIFTRDNFTCVLCGIKGIYLEADHYPKRFSKIIEEYRIKTFEQGLICEELWNINNGRTLCKKCHYNHTWNK